MNKQAVCCWLLLVPGVPAALAQTPAPKKPRRPPAAVQHQAIESSPELAEREPWPYFPKDYAQLEQFRLAHPHVPAHADSVYTVVEQMPSLPGQATTGDLARALQQRVAATPNPLAGRIFVQFEVTRQGLASYPRIVKSLRPDMDSAVLVAVRQLPRFVSGRHNGKPVAVYLTLPITFGASQQP